MTATYNHFDGYELPLGLRIEISSPDAEGTKFIAVLAPQHIRKRVPVSFQYGECFTDEQILRDSDLRRWLHKHYDI